MITDEQLAERIRAFRRDYERESAPIVAILAQLAGRRSLVFVLTPDGVKTVPAEPTEMETKLTARLDEVRRALIAAHGLEVPPG